MQIQQLDFQSLRFSQQSIFFKVPNFLLNSVGRQNTNLPDLDTALTFLIFSIQFLLCVCNIYIVTILYQNFMVTENQKSTKDIYKKRNSITNSTLKIAIQLQEKITKKKKKEEGKKQDLQKQTQKMNKMAIGTYISMFSLNVNGLNALTKDIHLLDGYENKPVSVLSTRDPLQT